MIFEFEAEHYALDEVIFELIRKENKELKAVDKEVFFTLQKMGKQIKQAIENLINIFRYYLMYISESIKAFNIKGYDKILSITPPPKISSEELQRVFTDIHQHPEKMAEYDWIYFSRKELDYIFNSYEKRKEGYFIPSINEELLTRNTHEAQIIKIQTEQIKQLEKQVRQNKEVHNTMQSAKTNNAKDKVIKALLAVHYGEDVAEHPRRHILEHDKTQGVKNANGEIQKAFDLAWYEIPVSGRTLQNWLDGVPLPQKII